MILVQCPFEGDIVVELLHWRQDNHHYRERQLVNTMTVMAAYQSSN